MAELTDHIAARRTLPVFRLDNTATALGETDQFLQKALGFSLGRLQTALSRGRRYEVPNGIVDIDESGSTLWYADRSLWQVPQLAATWRETRDNAPLNTAGIEDYLSLLRPMVRSSLPAVALKLTPRWSAAARFVLWDRATNTRKTQLLHHAVQFAPTVSMQSEGLPDVPVSGPGVGLTGRFTASGKCIGARNGQINIVESELYPAMAKADCDVHLMQHFPDDEVMFNATLSYRALDTDAGPYLCPYWIYEVVVRRRERWTLAGYYPVLAVVAPAFARVALRTANRPEPARPLDWGTNPDRPRALLSWIGEDGRLLLSRGIRNDTEDLLVAAGWTCHAVGDANAYESDWRGPACEVNLSDLGIYVGHADYCGMQLHQPTDDWIDDSECFFGDRLKWVLVDACGPLQDRVTGSGGSSFEIWGKSFKGMRSLLGFATSRYQSSCHLSDSIQFALTGQPLSDAWFTAACQQQGASHQLQRPVWVAGLFGVAGSDTTCSDTLGGPLAPPIDADPDALLGIWVPAG